MNYEKIYNSLIEKRQLNPLFKKECYCEAHHIKPKSIYPELIRDKNNIINLTAKEHYVAHHLLMLIYKKQYGNKHIYYKKMLNAFLFTCYINNGQTFITATMYEKLKLEISRLRIGTKAWNSGKKGIFSNEYRKKISKNHADCSGEKNGRFGSRSMYNEKMNIKKLIPKDEVQNYLNNGWVFIKDLHLFNNNKIEVYSKECPIGFKRGKLRKLKLKLVSNIKTNKSCYITEDKLQEYLNNGFILGKLKIWVKNIKTGKSIYIKKSKLNDYLNNRIYIRKWKAA